MSDFVKIEKDKLLKLAQEIEGFDRQGNSVDSPEGARYVIISDTLPARFSNTLIELAKNGTVNTSPR